MADKFEDLRTYLTVISTGGVNAAAAQLGIAKSAVSRRLGELESRLGVTLIERTTRKFEPTAAGRAYYDQARRLMSALEDLDRTFDARVEASTLVVEAPGDVASGLVVPPLPEFLKAHPGLRVRIVEPGGGEPPDLRFAIVSAAGTGEREVGPVRSAICASPTYLRAHGAVSLGTLSDHAGIEIAGLKSQWRFGDGVLREPRIALSVGDLAAAIAAAVGGVGLAHLPLHALAAGIARGDLEIALPDAALPASVLVVSFGTSEAALAAQLADRVSAGMQQPGR